jgi:D-arabinan exo alpha-(1,3)/(1,5)-arabinofuranosidase (non-reducing end)
LALLMGISVSAGTKDNQGKSEVTTGVLINEMIDLNRLTENPEPSYSVFQVSSYDRRSKVFGGENWFANSDGFGKEPLPGVAKVLREPGENHEGIYLLADVKGPGAIVRTWTARMNGEITMWLDGADEPSFKGPANDFLKGIYPALAVSGGPEAKTYENAMTQRDAGYYPVPFAKKCRIEWKGNLEQLHFYHIEFRKYDQDTVVQTFSPSDLITWKRDIQDVCELLDKPANLDGLISEKSAKTFEQSTILAAGKNLELASVEGRAGKITLLKTRLRADTLKKALRQTILTIAFDKASRPQVEAPLGDFYGAAPGINPFDALPMTVESDGWMTCRFVMPFSGSMLAVIENRGGSEVEIESKILVEDYEWQENSSLYFNGKWRIDHEMDVGGGLIFDLPYILVNGPGRFVGCAAILLNPAEGPHPSGSWWGEGDEKIYVDDDKFPSFFGTGSEDYFNYSWSSPELFSHAYFGQPRNDGPGNGGFVSNNRWHILDDLPFQDRLSFYMEMFTHTRVTGLSYARTTWFYSAPGAWDDNMPIFREDIRAQKRPEWTPAAVGGTKDAIFTQMEDMAGNKENLVLARPEWAAGKILDWEPEGENDSLELEPFNVPKTGEYDLYLVMILTPESGKFSAKLDGEMLLDAEGKEWIVDLYTPFQTMARRNGPGHPLKLEGGDHCLTLISRGSNQPSKGSVIQGDFIWIRERK